MTCLNPRCKEPCRRWLCPSCRLMTLTGCVVMKLLEIGIAWLFAHWLQGA